jgi:hypothetical protein
MMALSIPLRDTFPMGRLGPFDCERFWKISLYRATIARELAKNTSRIDPEEAFLAGLLLEIGFLVLLNLYLKTTTFDKDIDILRLDELLEFEKNEFGIHHRELGEFLLLEWKLPEEVAITQRAGVEKDVNSYTPLQTLCYCSMLCSNVLVGMDIELSVPYEDCKTLLKIDSKTVDNVLIHCIEQIETLAESLKIQMNKVKDIMELMEKANKTLTNISERIAMSANLTDQLPTIDTIRSCSPENLKILEAIAHEIRNPLLAVGGFVKRLAKTLDPQSKGAEYVNIILKEAERLENVLSELKQLTSVAETHYGTL